MAWAYLTGRAVSKALESRPPAPIAPPPPRAEPEPVVTAPAIVLARPEPEPEPAPAAEPSGTRFGGRTTIVASVGILAAIAVAGYLVVPGRHAGSSARTTVAVLAASTAAGEPATTATATTTATAAATTTTTATHTAEVAPRSTPASVFVWPAKRGAREYFVRLYRDGRELVAAHTTLPRRTIPTRMRSVPGEYRWIVTPIVGRRALAPIVDSTFVVHG
jgi:hypothetical protein